jgi:hypothetical protein
MPRAEVYKLPLVALDAFCSKTGERFRILARREGDTLHWTGVKRLKSQSTDSSEAHIFDTSKEPSEVTMQTYKWACPVCGTAQHSTLSYVYWYCRTCFRIHCIGTTSGKVKGGCGAARCIHDPATFTLLDRVNVETGKTDV